MSENVGFAETLSIIVIGFGIVFAVLAVIFLMMLCMKLVFYTLPQKRQQAISKNDIETLDADLDEEGDVAAVITVIATVLDKDPKDIKLKLLTEQWQSTFQNNIGGNNNEKFYSKDKWKNI